MIPLCDCNMVEFLFGVSVVFLQTYVIGATKNTGGSRADMIPLSDRAGVRKLETMQSLPLFPHPDRRFGYQLHCNTHCNTLQHTATHCSSLQHTVTHNVLHGVCAKRSLWKVCLSSHILTAAWDIERTATHYRTLQHTATHCNVLQHTATLHLIGTYYNSQQHTLCCNNTLQYTMCATWTLFKIFLCSLLLTNDLCTCIHTKIHTHI